jgi:tetratricopeptide (TPR) repeat protein
MLAEAAHFRQDRAAARMHADSAAALLERQAAGQPEDAKTLAWIGLAHAFAGRSREAIAAGGRAAELLPPSLDANSGPYVLARLARIYMLAGEPDLATATLESLLLVPSWITVPDLRHDPTWALLQSHPRFMRLVAGGA